MKERLLSILFAIQFTVGLSTLYAQRINMNINDSWRFGSGTESEVVKTDFNDSGWNIVNLPYTWNGLDGQDGGNDLFRGVRWYRKTLFAESAWEGKKVFLRFGSANMKTDVYINGTAVGAHTGGYAAFIFDISEYLNFDAENVIAVKVDNSASIDAPPLSGDFSFFGGITRDVELIITDKVFISPLDYASPGVYITPHNITENKADVNIQVLVGNHNTGSKNVEVTAYIRNMAGEMTDSVKTSVSVDPEAIVKATMDIDVENPVLWDAMLNPYLYSVEVSLKSDNSINDAVIQPLGFRTFSVDADTGFVLNGKKYNLHGVCLHEDRPDVGRAISNENRREDLEILQDLGCTYLRLVHYQHGEYTYDYCDSAGMILSTEVPLVNRINSTTAFTQNSRSQLNELIKQNYNHPSVFFWGMFNEINFHTGPDPAALISELNTLAHQLDSTRLTTGAAQNDEAETHWVLDVCGWNKYMGWYDGSFEDFGPWADWLRSAHPGTKIGLSEYGAGASIYHHQESSVRPNPGGQFHPEEYQCDYHEAYYQAMLERPFIWSSAVWVAFDFASDYRNEGDAAGINDKGLVTRDRKVKKDAFFYYKANWSDDPFVYITSRRFTERTNGNTKVKVYSNCDSVELKVNNELFESLKSENHIFTWQDINLIKGENKILVNGYSGGNTFVDSCVWNYNKTANDTLLPGDLKINFQPAGSATPEGYLPDVGSAYGDRDNGFTYGWIPSNTENTRERSFISDPVFNTFNHIIKNDVAYTWEIAVDNGVYQVSIGCGDPDYTDSYHKILVEGQLVLEGFNTATAMKVATDTVTVTDGKLTVRPAFGASNAKINFIYLTQLEGIIYTKLEIQNGSFELPEEDLKYRADGNSDGGLFNGNVPGWWADGDATDCGRQNTSKPAYDGKYTGYAFNNDYGSIWAVAGTVQKDKRNLDLSFWAWESFPKGQSGVSVVAKFAVYDGPDPSAFTLLETLTQPFDAVAHDENGWGNFIFSYTLPESAEGKNLLIGFDIVTEGTADTWFSFDNFSLIVSEVTGIGQLTGSGMVKIFPNPANGIMTIQMNSNDYNGTYTFYTVSGKEVLSGRLWQRSQAVNVSALEKGVYLIKIENSSGSQIIRSVLE
ncbi:glycoside hydrolase family 2 TIM barrel-domain containing protein [Saccharicrinis sp. FJH54]|uniref:glycoside hydrolase family 2 TIM barrel-domain containing protein n=1 Tax=Saccharicrinis sp. FJH54 TaxID=3344665 RepID=UPI0035D4B15E